MDAGTFGHEGSDFFIPMSPNERFEEALGQGEKIHDNYRRYAENFVSIPWCLMNHHMSCFAQWTEETRKQYLGYLQTPLAGRHFMMGIRSAITQDGSKEHFPPLTMRLANYKSG